jgi:ABC-type oligopeptide transport system ATPase subunit
MMDNNRPLLEIRDLKVTFPHGKNAITAVDSISFSVDRGTTLGIVGESGSGKSTVARAVMQLITPNSGEILFDGQNLTKMSKSELREIRKRTQMVFQDPGGSLNEYMQVGKIITEPLLVHGISKGKELQKRSEELLNQVGLESKDAKRYPHEFSGGQKQRIAIARSIAIHPELLVCDEPTSALDVTVQAKILKLLSNLRDELGLTILFISHDLAVINEFCSKVLVMANGKIVESGAVNDVIQNPTHEITKELIASSYA